MADSAETDGGGSAAPDEPAPSSHSIMPAPSATFDHQHVCFICLQNDTDTPDAKWVHPCPCSLEAHEECMLHWVADMEASSGRSKDNFKCPACKARITIHEPHDTFLALQDGLYRRYSRLTPYILCVLVSGGGFAGASWYGFCATALFAGHGAVQSWLTPRQGFLALVLKMWALTSIGPGLLIMRWLPSLGTAILLPISTIRATSLIAHNDFFTWPPSPQWAIVLVPYVQLSYSCLFRDLLGPLERRWNRILRGLPAAEDPADPREGPAPAVVAPGPAAQAVAAQNHVGAGRRPEGIWEAVANAGAAVLALLPHLGHLDVDVRINNADVNVGVDVDVPARQDGPAPEAGDLVEMDEDDFEVLAADIAAQLAEQPLPAPEEEQLDLQPPPEQNVRNIQNVQQHNHNNNNNNANNNNDNDMGEIPHMKRFINGVVSALLLPAISYGMGELIRAVAPKAWVTPPRVWPRRPTGLLQERWGRSLVGGCVFVVLRDAISLYTKYRLVQVKTSRTVKNIDRKSKQDGTGQGARGSGEVVEVG